MLTILSDDFSPFPFKEQLASSISKKKSCILLVPEQLALSTEKQVAESFPENTPLFLEVSNFSRLADRVFRAEGGISYRYADHADEIVLMWKTLDALSPWLSSKKHGSADTVKEQLSALSELSSAGIKPDALRHAAEAIEKPALKAKISDLAMIYDHFEAEKRGVYGSHADDLDKLYTILKSKPLFAETEIYVFGFTSFTASELKILGELMRAGNVFVALSLPDEKSPVETSSLAYVEVLATKKALLEYAEKVGCRHESLPSLSHARPAMLAHAKENLFRADGVITTYEENDGTLSFINAKDPYEGCAHIASTIASCVRGGMRYRDFAIVTRSPEKYDGILDEALAMEGIPYFFSVETDLTELSLTKMILSAYACLEHGFRRADLIAYLKCGFSGVSADDCDVFELYCEKWRIKGKTFTEDRPFDMHPQGYSAVFSDKDTERLARINAVRAQVIPPLLALREATQGEKTTLAHATALYNFLVSLDTERRLFERARQERSIGRVAESERLSRLTPVLYDLLDRIQGIMGEQTLTRARFSELLSTVFSSVSLGTLPTSGDAVTVANADTYRPAIETTVFLLGAVEGEFPASVSLDGVFPEAERRELEKHDIFVGKPPEVRASREQFSFLRCIASATSRAIVVDFGANALGEALRPSTALVRLKKLFPAARCKKGTPKPCAPRAAFEGYFEKKNTAEGAALTDLLTKDEAFARTLAVSATPIEDALDTVSKETAARLFPDDMQTSQSKLNDYIDCPFAYYLKRAVYLQENEQAAVRPIDVGNMIHKILEKFTLSLSSGDTDITKIVPLVEEACRDYLNAICPDSMLASPRLSHLFARLRRAAVLVAADIYDEFLHSRFKPAFCELNLEDKDGPGALVFRDADGKTVSIGGRVDRVDTYRDASGELFVRVVDYKTSGHTFSREELKNGRNLQMFVYLCAIWKTESDAFLARLNLKEGEHPLPAGIVYSIADPKTASIDTPMDADALLDVLRTKNLARTGFFLAEEDVVRAMDDNFSHISGILKKGVLDLEKKSVFGSLVEFGTMLDETEDAVLRIARDMRTGCANAKPADDTNPCSYCPYIPVCRKSNIKKKRW